MQSIGRQFIPLPVTEKILWHLIPLDKLFKLETFLKGGLWLSRLDTFEPKGEEGELPSENVNAMKTLGKNGLARLLKYYDEAKLYTYASCWTRSDHETPDFMDVSPFGNGGNAIAIQTTPLILQTVAFKGFQTTVTNSASNTSSSVFFGAANYIDHSSNFIQEAQTIAAAFALNRNYMDTENEARLLVYCNGGFAISTLCNIEGPFGFLARRKPGPKYSECEGNHADGKAMVIFADPNKLIQSIRVGKMVSQTGRDSILGLVNKYSFDSNKLIYM